MATPSPETRTTVVRRQAFNFETFQKDKLAKTIKLPAPVNSLQEALARFGNNESALLKVVNVGLDENTKAEAWSSKTDWTLSEKNLPTQTKFAGDIIQPGGVMQTVRTLAMTIFGMTPEMTKDEKKARRQKALEFIKANSEIREGLKNQALAEDTEDEDDD